VEETEELVQGTGMEVAVAVAMETPSAVGAPAAQFL
jgi:hypothetical protein